MLSEHLQSPDPRSRLHAPESRERLPRRARTEAGLSPLFHQRVITKEPKLGAPAIAEVSLIASNRGDPVLPRQALVGSMFVYLLSGVVEIVDTASCLRLLRETVCLDCEDGSLVEYPRSGVYLVTHELISAPGFS